MAAIRAKRKAAQAAGVQCHSVEIFYRKSAMLQCRNVPLLIRKFSLSRSVRRALLRPRWQPRQCIPAFVIHFFKY